ncbi:transcriptional regulator, TetR family [Mucilaginibacter pineti]|uniref:Transcriptional regulator, TetR family n=1 Tax=Mucilaginibacter pineti TaxID=1391627 RepID=A0A1G6XYH8_9SPHI|nr:TetR/AcrR family transcriptional regulator [Mucilaginibacter pineti]SDD82507.1 transcriptional regulator, TetR family [Mucilaginibacter pineti]
MSAIISTKEDLMQQQILAAAKRLFQVYGLAKVTMDDVAKAIGKGRSSLYYYYKSKDEIFDAVIKIEIREMLAAMTHAVNEASGAEQKLYAFFLTKLEVLREKRAFFKMVDAGMDADALSQFQKTKIVHHNLIIRLESALLGQVLTDGMNNGELRKVEASELEMLILVLLSSLRGLKREMELEDNAEKVLPAVDMFTRMAMYGLK